MLADALAAVRRRIAKNKKLNENDTKATLVEPVLAALGWDVLDPEEVAREHKPPRAKPVDYALLVMREPKLYVEAKALGESLGESKVAHQIMGYAAVAGVEWIVLTNGDEWRIYNSHATVPVDQKLLRAVRISDSMGGVEEILALLSKDQLKTKLIDALWRAHFVDRKVKAAIEGFFLPGKDLPLVNHVRGVAQDLTAEDIRSSMRRCKLTIDFPLSPGDVARSKTSSSKPDGAKKSPTMIGVTLAQLIQAKLIKPTQKLVARYKSQELHASVVADGQVEYAGRKYPSLSAAGSMAVAAKGGLQQSGEPRAINGWDFWHIENENKKLVPIGRLREQLLGAGNRPSAATVSDAHVSSRRAPA